MGIMQNFRSKWPSLEEPSNGRISHFEPATFEYCLSVPIFFYHLQDSVSKKNVNNGKYYSRRCIFDLVRPSSAVYTLWAFATKSPSPYLDQVTSRRQPATILFSFIILIEIKMDILGSALTNPTVSWTFVEPPKIKGRQVVVSDGQDEFDGPSSRKQQNSKLSTLYP